VQITETLNETLHREFKIVVGAKDLEDKLTGKIVEMQPRIHLKGFRPGKAPVSYLKKAYGKSLMGEIVNNAVNESSEQALKERELKPATTPRIDFANEIEQVVDGKADLEFTMKVDLMPDFEVANLPELSAERLVAEVSDQNVDEALQRLAQGQKVYTDKSEGAAAEQGDAVTIDFEGRLDGTPFEGGKGDDFDLTLGSGSFIPGFEDQLVGAKAGDQRLVKVTFPSEYGAAHLAGKEAEFDVTVKAVKAAGDVPVDENLAASLGVDSLAALRDAVRTQLKGDYGRASRTHLKRRILDSLDAAHHFALPPGMVEAEFGAIWRQVQVEMEKEGKTPEEESKSEDDLKAEYRAIAERRVRLGLVLAKIGEQNGLSVSQEELNRAVAAQARRYPGQEQKVYDYIANNPQALAEIRVPLFEDKVVDFIAELIQVHDRVVDRDTLYLDPDTAAEKLQAAGGTQESVTAEPEADKEEKPKAKKKKKE
jgi:trigger factor